MVSDKTEGLRATVEAEFKAHRSAIMTANKTAVEAMALGQQASETSDNTAGTLQSARSEVTRAP